MKNKFDGVLFDFDGTIANTSKGIYNGFDYARREMGFRQLTAEELSTVIGPPLFGSFKDFYGVEDAVAHELVAKYREYYSVKGIYEIEIYDGMEKLFADLKSAGVKIGVATAKPQNFTEKALIKLDVLKYMDTLVGPDFNNISDSKVDIINKALHNIGTSPDRTCMVGDKRYDIEGAKSIKITGVGVLYGFGSREELENAQADYIVSDVKSLYEFLLGDSHK